MSKIDPEQPGGWIGFTDKYWLAAVLPDQDRNYSFAFNRHYPTDRYQVDFIDTAGMVVAPGAASPRCRLCRSEKGHASDHYAEDFGIPLDSPLILAGFIF